MADWKKYYSKEKAAEYGRKYREKKRLEKQGLAPQAEEKPSRPAKKPTTHSDGTRSYNGTLVYLPRKGETFPSDVTPVATVRHKGGGVSYKHPDGRWWGPYSTEQPAN